LNGVHVPELHGSVASEQIEISPDPQLVAQCDAVNPDPRLNPHVASRATVPFAQHTGPRELLAQSTGPSQSHWIEPVIGHVVPSVSHVDPSVLVLGASQHCCPAVQ
jgi:hypothetical protein